MEFETNLSQEQIKQRLNTYAKPMTRSAHLTEHQFLAKWNKDDSFELLETGGFLAVRPVLPFVGRVEQHGDSNTISGKFALSRTVKTVLAYFFGIALAAILFIGFLNAAFDLLGTIIVISMLLIWATLLYALFRFVPGIFQKKQQAVVVEFIEKYLLD